MLDITVFREQLLYLLIEGSVPVNPKKCVVPFKAMHQIRQSDIASLIAVDH